MDAANAVPPALSDPYLNGQPIKTLQLQEANDGTKDGPGGFVYFGVDEREPDTPEKTSRRVIYVEKLSSIMQETQGY